MKSLLAIFSLTFFLSFQIANSPTPSAYTIEGVVLDQGTGEPLIGVNILLKGTTKGTTTDIDGTFSLTVPDSCASIWFAYIGYKERTETLCAGPKHEIKLTGGVALDEVVVTAPTASQKKEMSSSLAVAPASPSRRQDRRRMSNSRLAPGGSTPEPSNTEQYNAIAENEFIPTSQENFSTFGIDVDAASYSNIRRFLRQGQLPPTDAVRIEEMINYFHYEYTPPRDQHPFQVESELASCPWNPETQLLLVGLRGRSVAERQLPTANFVFLLDVSGSMQSADKLPLLIQSLEMLTDNLREADKVSIVVYAGAAGVVLEPTSGANKQKIKEALRSLRAGGSTAGAEGIERAYALAREQFVEGGNNRVILATDGDFNVGLSSQAELEALITEQRENGIFLSVLGFGTGNLQDGKMETLADKGNGNYAYIDQLSEARKVLVREFGGTLFTIAKDVKLQVEFNPNQVASYRLIGYENRLLNKEDFRDDRKDAGELGAGHTVTALYEIVPQANALAGDPAAILRLRYKNPDEEVATEFAHELATDVLDFEQASTNLRWAAVTAEWGMLLRSSKYRANATYAHCRRLARQAKGRDPFGYRAEMIELLKVAERLEGEIATE